jgi:hypothetical protein
MTDEDSSTGMQNTPTTACCVVGTPPGSGDTKAIMFGATVRLKNMVDLQLKNAYHVTDISQKTPSMEQKSGHCAETYPYIYIISNVRINRVLHSA